MDISLNDRIVLVDGGEQVTNDFLTRAFAPGEKAEAAYGIEILRRHEPDGDWETVASSAYATTPLAESTYKECPKVVPGQSKRNDIDVPEGTWTYELRAVDTGTRGLTARILIPKADLGLGS